MFYKLRIQNNNKKVYIKKLGYKKNLINQTMLNISK